jgi:hypothetical protein
MMLNSIDEPEVTNQMTTSTEQNLIQFMTDWGNISGRRDTAALAEMLPDDLVLTMADGTFLTKAQYLDGFSTIPVDFTIADFDQQATIYNEAAIVTARYIFAIGGRETPMRYTTTFIKREGHWQPVAFHSCPAANH